MTETNLNSQLINSYLQQQMKLTTLENDGQEERQVINYPSGQSLDEFKDAVRAFVEIDTTIKKLRTMLKERVQVKTILSSKISEFMSTYEIDDLNTEHGKIRYKMKVSKVGLSKNQIKEQLTSEGNGPMSVKSIEEIFGTRLEKSRQVLQRLKKN